MDASGTATALPVLSVWSTTW